MASFKTWAALTDYSRWKPEVKARALKAWVITVTAGVLIAVLLATASFVFRPAPQPDTYQAQSQATRATNFGSSVLLVWLAGTPSLKGSLLAMSSAAEDIELGETPFEVRQIEPGDITRYAGDDATEWVLQYTATLLPPGTGGRLQRVRYQVIALERDGAFQLLTWPTPVTQTPKAFKAKTAYTGGVSRNSRLWESVARFAQAYLAPPKDGKSSDLGQLLVSGSYRGGTLETSPYSSVEVQKIQTSSSGGDPDSSTPGTTVQVLAEVKASATSKSWHVISLPLTLTLSGGDANKNWLVDRIDAPVRWGEVSDR